MIAMKTPSATCSMSPAAKQPAARRRHAAVAHCVAHYVANTQFTRRPPPSDYSKHFHDTAVRAAPPPSPRSASCRHATNFPRTAQQYVPVNQGERARRVHAPDLQPLRRDVCKRRDSRRRPPRRRVFCRGCLWWCRSDGLRRAPRAGAPHLYVKLSDRASFANWGNTKDAACSSLL